MDYLIMTAAFSLGCLVLGLAIVRMTDAESPEEQLKEDEEQIAFLDDWAHRNKK